MAAITETYQVTQTRKITVNRPRPLAGIGGDNETNFYLFFPGMPPGMRWVFPFVYGFLYPLPVAQYGAFLIDPTTQPGGAAVPGSTSSIALLTAYGASDVPLGYSPGTPSTAQTVPRWNINSAPATGSQASAVRAASAGVTHIGDSAAGAMVQTGATVSGVAFQILDGASTLFTLTYSLPAVNGQSVQAGPFGPGLVFRGGTGNSMTCRWSGALVGVAESVTMAGVDQ